MTETEIEQLRRRTLELEAENARLKALLGEVHGSHVNDPPSEGEDAVGASRKDRGELKASEVRQRAVFDSSVDFAIVVTDREGRVTDWNTGAERAMGWSAQEMIGQPLGRIFTAEDRASGRPEHEMRQALAEGRANDERWHSKADGNRFFASGEMMPLLDAQDAHLGFVKLFRDRSVGSRVRDLISSRWNLVP